jgi:hypothetical protein
MRIALKFTPTNTQVSTYFFYTGFFEQPSFIDMYKRNEMNLRDHTSVIPQRAINSFMGQYQAGDFVLHGAGVGYTRLERYLDEEGLAEF